jgi:HAE1 family hydrophobic/amphiphilic exporter-1
VAGELFRDLSLAVTFSLLASLLVALTLLPMLAARFGVSSDALARGEVNEVVDDGGAGTTRGGPLIRVLFAPFRWLWALAAGVFAELGAIVGAVAAALGRTTAPVLDAFDRLFEAFAARYHAALEGALDRPGRVLASAATILAVSLAVALTLPRDLLPDVDQGALTVRLEMPEGTALDATDEVAGYIEGAIIALPEVTAVFSTVGRDVREYATGEEASGLHTARLSVRLREGAEGEGVAARIRSLVAGLPVGVVSVESGGGTALGAVLGGSEADVSVRVRGDDLDPVLGVAEIVAERMRSVSSLANVRIGTVSGQPQVQIEIDRAACARYGIDPLSVARTVDDAMRGAVATQFVSFDRKIDVVVRYPESLRYARETLEGLRVGGIPLRELTTIRDAIGPVEVRREAQGRVVPVYADVTQGGLDVAVVDIDAALAGLEPAADVRWDVGGENEEMRRSFRDLGFAFALALILVYMILAAQFESFVQPLTILVSVPLALVGVVAALLAAGQGLNTMSLIGVVILVGIVVNDAIVKVDLIQQMRASGLEVRAAILEAGRVRLRPILMTTVTTILGLTPMALGVGRGADLRAPLAIAVIGGLGVATVLTLLVVPVVYQVIEGIRSNLLRQTR